MIFDDEQNKNQNKDLHSKKSVVDEKFRNCTYSKILPVRLFNYWLNKLFSEKMNISVINEDGSNNDEAVKRIAAILKRSNFRDAVSKYLSKKSLTDGYGAITWKLVDDFKGEPIPMFQVAESVVRYDTFAETDMEVQVIERITRGIVPILRVKTYGKFVDKLSYELEEDFSISDYEGDDKEDIEKLLKTTETIVHNYGFVRALVFRNRVDDKHYDYGQTDLNGYEELIDNIDIIANRMNTEIDLNSSHLSRTLSSGTLLGSGDNDLGQFDNYENQVGTTKETYRTLATEEGVDSQIVSGIISLEGLSNEIQKRIAQLDQITGIQVGYDATGKTNDTSTKSNMIGDPAHKEATLRRSVEEEFWTKAIEVAMKLDPKKEIWENVSSINVSPRINDFRNKIEMMEKLDKISKYIPLTKLYEDMFDVSSQEAQDMLDNKEQEAKEYMVSGLAVMNGNLPQNTKADLEWAIQLEPEDNSGEGDEDEEDKGMNKE